ncbi:hypothetical protein WH87_09225 [Devosia epidermidihirudinis]|uniref:Uncharacterized protein n=1 Tax=Devosia epidermidihirudinis TaxID=1293439 RepID=A0A0F5QAU5_9HYPH|nr:hypothetical protein [Devosia epidermidihirudinis]KKC37851.1 hypothetical protein WH87_09225 [Devosia epidermidihirudinis]
MAWQILAIVVIVGVTIVLFMRDERRRKSDLALARAAQYYARVPYQPHAWAPLPEPSRPRRRTGGLSETQRSALRRLAAK